MDPSPGLTRADLPARFTPDTIRGLTISVLRQLSQRDNGVLSQADQAEFDAALREVMSLAAQRVTSQIDREEWGRVRGITRGLDRGRFQGRNRSREQDVRRLADRIDRSVLQAEQLAPGVDWSALQVSGAPATTPSPATSSDPASGTGSAGSSVVAATASNDNQTIAELEDRLAEQVELVQVMSEIADMSRRTYALERQRDLENTRNVFFGFIVSVAVIAAGWAPLVADHDWDDRWQIVGLTFATLTIAGVVYYLVRVFQKRQDAREEASEESAPG